MRKGDPRQNPGREETSLRKQKNPERNVLPNRAKKPYAFLERPVPLWEGEETPENNQVTTTRPVKEKVPYCLTEVAYPQAKMMATIAKKPIHPIKLGFVPTIL